MKEKRKYRKNEDIILNNKFIKNHIILNRYMYKKEYERKLKILEDWCYRNEF